MSLVCITNDIPDLRPCTVPLVHAAHCDGWATRWDRDLGMRVSTEHECKGCLPVLAEHGLLCYDCWEKLRDGLEKAVDIITHLRSVDRAAQTDNAGVRGSATWQLPIPNTWQVADDLLMLLGHPTPGFPSDANEWEVEAIAERYVDALDPDMWVATVEGASAAARFNATMYSALIQHPMEDYEHRVRNVRCWKCQHRSLLWKPPLMFEGPIRVTCTNPACGFELGPQDYGWMSALEQMDVKQRLDAERNKLRQAKRAKAAAERRAIKEAAIAERERAAAELAEPVA